MRYIAVFVFCTSTSSLELSSSALHSHSITGVVLLRILVATSVAIICFFGIYKMIR